MPQPNINLAEAFPAAPALPLLQVPHPVHFAGNALPLVNFNFAQLVTSPDHPMHLHPWHPDQVAIPHVLIGALRSLQHPSADTATLIFLLYIWSTPDVQQLLSQDPRLAANDWKSFCDLLADAFPAATRIPANHTSGILQIVPYMLNKFQLTPADKARLVCRVRESLRIGGVLTISPVTLDAPLHEGVDPHAPLAILREGPIAIENAVIYSDAAWELSQNAMLQVLRLFEERGDDDLRDCAANIITTLLKVQHYSLSAIRAVQDVEDNLLELRQTIENQTADLPIQPDTAPFTAAAALRATYTEQHPPMIDLTINE
ncbi:hypothetical protein ACEPAI_7294 [Sanghuangporus weigelae]